MISPINFTGIKNTGYCWINNENKNNLHTKISLNTQLTYKDKKQYDELIRQFPDYKNEVASNFANIELDQDIYDTNIRHIIKLNGIMLDPTNEDEKPVWNFVQKIIDKVKTQDIKDFEINKDYITSDDCHFGLIYDEDFDKYINRENGVIGLFENTKLQAKHHDSILEVLHTPELVKSGAKYLSTFIEIINQATNNK